MTIATLLEQMNASTNPSEKERLQKQLEQDLTKITRLHLTRLETIDCINLKKGLSQNKTVAYLTIDTLNNESVPELINLINERGTVFALHLGKIENITEENKKALVIAILKSIKLSRFTWDQIKDDPEYDDYEYHLQAGWDYHKEIAELSKLTGIVIPENDDFFSILKKKYLPNS